MTPEGRIKDKVKRALARLTYRSAPYLPAPISVPVYSFMPVQNGFGKPGLDFYLCINGKFVAIETKARFGVPMTARQTLTAQEITQAGGLFFLVYDDDTLSKAIAAICNKCGVDYCGQNK